MAKYEIEIVNCWSLNVRKGPGNSYRVVQWAQRGQRFTSSNQQSGWYYIDQKGGWSYGRYIKVLRDVSPKPAPPPAPAPPPPPPPPPAPQPPKPAPPPAINYNAVASVLRAKNEITSNYKTFGRDGRIPTVTEKNPVIKDWKATDTLNTFGSKNFDVTIANYKLDYSFIRENLNIIRENYNISREGIRDELFEKFDRFKLPYPDYYITKTFPYVFFTRPDLNLLNEKGDALNSQFSNDPMFSYLFNNNSNIIRALTSKFSNKHDFHPYLSNTANSFEVSDEYIKTIEHGETYTGYKLQYGRHNIESNTAGQFSIQYNDDADYTIYKTHKAWIEYISRVYRGSASPNREYIKAKILDYASSVYYFVCGADGETILFWQKYFGVFPTNTPASAGSWRRGEAGRIPEFTINYVYSMKEDMSPLTLAEFNMNSSQDDELIYRKVYEPVLASTGHSMANAPFIATDTDSHGHKVFKLKFRD